MTNELMSMPAYTVIMLMLTVLILVGSPVFDSILDGQTSGTKVQQWIDKERDIKILFSHSPEKPIADSRTTLNFSIQSFTTGQNIHNLSANVVIINDFQKAFQFLNIPVSNGDFSLSYSFPSNGHNQILLNLKKNSFGFALASFDVSVLAPPPSGNFLFEAILFGVGFPVVAMVVIITLLKKKRGNLIFK